MFGPVRTHTGRGLTNAAVHRGVTPTGPGGANSAAPRRRRRRVAAAARERLGLSCTSPHLKTRTTTTQIQGSCERNSCSSQNKSFIWAVKHLFLRLFGSSLVFVWVLQSGAFPEVISEMRRLFKTNKKKKPETKSPKRFPCESLPCGKASFGGGVVGVQPRHVLLHLPPDHQEHLRHVLRELLAEECAAATRGENVERLRGARTEGRFCH